MEAFPLPLSRDVAHILFLEAVVAALVWALFKLIVKIRAWLWSIRQIRIDVARLHQDIMSLRAELLRSAVPVERISVTPSSSILDLIPPPLPPRQDTYNLTDEDLREDWDDEDEVTSSPEK